jgi:predicted nucleic acid-binding protein
MEGQLSFASRIPPTTFGFALRPLDFMICPVIRLITLPLPALPWFYERPRPFATCAVTEGTLLRLPMQFAEDSSANAAWETLALLRQMPGHEFWEEGFSYVAVSHQQLTNHRQVTDAWLACLARQKGERLATLDAALGRQHSDVTELLP